MASKTEFERGIADRLNKLGFARMDDEDVYELGRGDVQELLDEISAEISATLRRRDSGGAVSVRGLGRYRIVRRKATKAGVRNVFGTEMKVAAKPASRVLRVTGDRALREDLRVA